MRVRAGCVAATRFAVGLTAALLVMLSACGGPDSPPIEVPASVVPASADTEPASDVFPTLEPFVTSAFWEMLGGERDPRALADELEKLPEMTGRIEASLTGDTGGEVSPRKARLAELTPQVPRAQRGLWMLVPMLMASLKPQWGRGEWSADEIALARATGTFLERELGLPGLLYSGASPAQNRAWLRKLVAWFRAQVGRPELYAAMMAMFDDGPYVGLNVEIDRTAHAIASAQLSDDLTLEGHRTTIGAAEGYAIRALYKGISIWSRGLTDSRGRAYESVHLEGLRAEALGTYGWRLHFSVGGEHAHLYVAPDGSFLFYFVSW